MNILGKEANILKTIPHALQQKRWACLNWHKLFCNIMCVKMNFVWSHLNSWRRQTRGRCIFNYSASATRWSSIKRGGRNATTKRVHQPRACPERRLPLYGEEKKSVACAAAAHCAVLFSSLPADAARVFVYLAASQIDSSRSLFIVCAAQQKE